MIIVMTAGLGAVIGALARYAITNFGKEHFNKNFPYATLFINLTGTLILGIVYALKEPVFIYALVGTGVLGGYTTFSTLNVELLTHLKNHNYRTFIAYGLLSYGVGLILIFLGFWIGSRI